MSDLVARIDQAKEALLKKTKRFPEIVLVLGSGLGAIADDIKPEVEIPFQDIPHFKPPSVEGHRGRMVVGDLHGVRVACLLGRLHYYEGHSMADVVFPVRVCARAGAQAFLLSNAAGGLKATMRPLDFLLLRDHINLMGTNPLIGPNEEALGPRFPDLTGLYDRKLGDILLAAAGEVGATMHEGVYVGIHGPSYETPAEIRSYRSMGGDVVGMSTIPEAVALRHMGRKVVGLSCITNLAAGVTSDPLVHSDVLENGRKIYGRFSAVLGKALKKMEAALE